MDNGGEAQPSTMAQVKDIAGNFSGLLRKHAELAGLEAREQAQLYTRLLVIGGALLVAALLAFVLLNVGLIVLIGMNTGEWAATIFWFAAFYVAVTGVGVWATMEWWSRRPRSFPQSQAEWDKTKDWLKDLWPLHAHPRS